MNQKMLKHISIAFSVLILSACGGGGGSGDSTPSTMAKCYLLTPGNSITRTTTPSVKTYTLNGTTQSYATTETSTTFNNSTYAGKNVIKSHVVTPSTGATTDAYIAITDSLYTRLALISTRSDGTSNTATYSGFSRNLTLKPGQSQTYTYTTTNDTGGTHTTVATLTFIGFEDIATPTGIYKNACKQTLVQVTDGVPSPSLVSDTFWYAEGYGNVKEVVVNNYTDGRVPAGVTNTTE